MNNKDTIININESNNQTDVILDDNNDKKNIFYEKTCITCCLIFITLPIMICDFYFGFSNDPCLCIKFNGIDFGMGKWLQTCGFIQLISCLLIITIQCVNNELYQMFISIFIRICFGYFTVIWTIIGAIIFWKYIEPNNLCNNQLTTYLWVRIIMGIISSGTILFSNKNSDSD